MDVLVRSGEGMQQDVEIGRFQIKSDEPFDKGGTGTGPDPYDLLSAALGACTSMTLRSYARTKGWPLQSVEVRLHHEKIYAIDCAECETREGRIDKIVREITLEGPLDAAQQQRLLEIADKCPVHRTLQNEVNVVTRLSTP
jgi:putative redox protein